MTYDGPSVPASDRDANAADAIGAATDPLTALPDETQIAEDGVGTSAAGEPVADMVTVTAQTNSVTGAGDRALSGVGGLGSGQVRLGKPDRPAVERPSVPPPGAPQFGSRGGQAEQRRNRKKKAGRRARAASQAQGGE